MAYVPPHARSRVHSTPRSLDQLEESLRHTQLSERVKVALFVAHSTTPSEPPKHTTVQPNTSANSERFKAFDLTTEVGKERALLTWFAELSDVDQEAYLDFSASLSKKHRGILHKEAEALRLSSSSQGIGESRFLRIQSRHVSKILHTTKGNDSFEHHERALQIWRWCQEEGGACAAVSQAEVAEMLLASAELPRHIQHVVAFRDQGERLHDAISNQNKEEITTLLEANPQLIHVTTGKTNDTVLHTACQHNSSNEIIEMLLKHGAQPSRLNKRGQTPSALLPSQHNISQQLLDLLKPETEGRFASGPAEGSWRQQNNRQQTRPRFHKN